jgi:hypothetical protein
MDMLEARSSRCLLSVSLSIVTARGETHLQGSDQGCSSGNGVNGLVWHRSMPSLSVHGDEELSSACHDGSGPRGDHTGWQCGPVMQCKDGVHILQNT